MGQDNAHDTEIHLGDNMCVKTKIMDSGIAGAGKGRFFMEDCKKGTIVRVQSIDTDLFVYTNLEQLKQADPDAVINFAHTRPRDSDVEASEVFINKERLYTNHSNENNIAFKFVGNKKLAYTTRDVKAGEEMFQNYNDFSAVVWYETYLHSLGKMSLREFARCLDDNGSPESKYSKYSKEAEAHT